MAANYQKDTIVYQIYPRSFQDSNGDGIGDIPGIISRLDYIASLGVNTIWLSPVYASPDQDNGYDIADYKAIHPQFGTMDDFDRLVAEAKQRGIGIVMDLVINHTSDEHEWFQKALSGDPKYRDYYLIRKGEKGKLPNNWGNFFGDIPWSKFGDSEDEYYLHLFAPKQPDLNWHNPAVLEEVKDIMRFWLEKGVVGFRCDVINIIYKNTLADGKKQFALTGQEHYLSTPGCHDILATLRREVLEPYGAWAVGETVFVDLEQAKALTNHELDMLFAFEHMECDQIGLKWFKTRLKPKKLMQTLTRWQVGLDWNAVYFENHDQPRFISRFPDSQKYRRECSRMMAGLLMTLRGTPFVYEGQEIGMTNCRFASLDEIQDVESHIIERAAKGMGFPKPVRWRMIRRSTRDHARTPMQWDATPNAGFTTGKSWLKINENYREVNVLRDTTDPNGVSAFWKRMIALRKRERALCDGSFRSVVESDSVYAFERALGDDSLLSVCNLTGKAVKLPEDTKSWGTLVESSYGSNSDTLQPFEFRLLRK